MSDEMGPGEAILALIVGGIMLTMLAAPLGSRTSTNLELWGFVAILAGIGLGSLVVVVAVVSRIN